MIADWVVDIAVGVTRKGRTPLVVQRPVLPSAGCLMLFLGFVKPNLLGESSLIRSGAAATAGGGAGVGGGTCVDNRIPQDVCIPAADVPAASQAFSRWLSVAYREASILRVSSKSVALPSSRGAGMEMPPTVDVLVAGVTMFLIVMITVACL